MKGKINELISQYNVLRKEAVFENIEALLQYDSSLTVYDILEYIPEAFENTVKYPYHYEELTGQKVIYLDSLLSVLLMYQKAFNKYAELKMDEQEAADECGQTFELKCPKFPMYLCSACMQINEKIAKITELKNTTFPAAVEPMKQFEGEFVFNDVKYIIETPKTVKELILEGYKMHNCLVMRGPTIANGEWHVIFINLASKVRIKRHFSRNRFAVEYPI